MRFSVLTFASLPLAALAGSAHGADFLRQRMHSREFGATKRAKSFTLTDLHQGDSFFE